MSKMRNFLFINPAFYDIIWKINIPRRRATGYVVLIRYWSRVSYLMTAPEARTRKRAEGMKLSPRITGNG